jgi:hypothetical protein
LTLVDVAELADKLPCYITAENPGAHCISEINLNRLYAWAEKLGFSKEMAHSIIASPQSGSDIAAGMFDNKSVMNYSLPAEVLENGTASSCFVQR